MLLWIPISKFQVVQYKFIFIEVSYIKKKIQLSSSTGYFSDVQFKLCKKLYTYMSFLCFHSFVWSSSVFIEWTKVNSSPFSALVGSLQVTMYEKSCAVPSQCGVSGQKYSTGLYFNYTNVCCDTDLCNGAVSIAALSWGGVALCLLPALSVVLAWQHRRGWWW